jgi:hypothetical protein
VLVERPALGSLQHKTHSESLLSEESVLIQKMQGVKSVPEVLGTCHIVGPAAEVYGYNTTTSRNSNA